MSNQAPARFPGGSARRCLAISLAAVLAGCSSFGASGPSTRAITGSEGRNSAFAGQVRVVNLDDATVRRIRAAGRSGSLVEAIGDGQSFDAMVSKGDLLDIVVWEAPPAALFGAAISDPRLASGGSTGTSLPEQMVDTNGRIVIPFVGAVFAAGKTPAQIEREITLRLAGLAHQPQVIVRIAKNAAANVTVVGDVTNSGRIPLTPKGERLLDVLASSGGVKQAVGKTTIRVTRGERAAALPLEQIINDPAQNIRLQADDVVTALYQPYSFTALGAVGNNAEVSFEGTGFTLAQALGRIGGLRDDRANVKGVFIFRFEPLSALGGTVPADAPTTPDGTIPVIYRLNLADPANFFVAQGFQVRDKDILFVSNAPGTDLQKFVNIVSSMAFSLVGITNAVK